MIMNRKTLISVSAALALGVLGSASAFASNDSRDEDGNSASQATIDLREWHQGWQGQAVTGNGSNAYGFVKTQHPHRTHR
jgi:type II secretory pathway pseudopilin PulG